MTVDWAIILVFEFQFFLLVFLLPRDGGSARMFAEHNDMCNFSLPPAGRRVRAMRSRVYGYRGEGEPYESVVDTDTHWVVRGERRALPDRDLPLSSIGAGCGVG